MVRAFAWGFSVLIAAGASWGIAAGFKAVSDPLVMLVSLAPGVAALAASWKAPRWRFPVGILQAPLWAALWTVLNAALDAGAGASGDFPGARGAFWLFLLMLLGGLVPAAVGAAAGAMLGRRHSRGSRPTASER